MTIQQARNILGKTDLTDQQIQDLIECTGKLAEVFVDECKRKLHLNKKHAQNVIGSQNTNHFFDGLSDQRSDSSGIHAQAVKDYGPKQ